METTDVIQCRFCNTDMIYKYLSEYTYFHHKVICNKCRQQISTQEYLVQPQCLKVQTMDKYSTRCEIHTEECKLICEECDLVICGICIPNHKGHKISSLSSYLLYNIKDLELIGYILHKVQVLFPHKKYLLSTLKSKHTKLLFSSAQLAPQSFKKSTSSLYLELQCNIPQLSKLSLQTAYTHLNSYRIHKPIDTIHHWIDWGGNSLHLIDLNNNTARIRQFKTPGESQDVFEFPYYCRSVMLPDARILVCGGRDTTNGFGHKHTWILDNSRVPIIKSEMIIGRANHCVLYHNNYVYVVGGCNHENHFTNACERYDIDSDKWIQISSTNKVTDSAAAVVVPDQNCIYTFCGREDNAILNNTIEKYDISNDLWYLLPVILPINSHLTGACLISPSRNKILIFGGQNKLSEKIGKSFIFNLKTQSIEETDNMITQGGCIVDNALSFNSFILTSIFSGFDIRTYQIFDNGRKTWYSYSPVSSTDTILV